MFNVAVFNLKDIIKYFTILILIILAIFFVTKFFKSMQNPNVVEASFTEDYQEDGLFDYDFTGCIDTTTTIVGSIKTSKNNKVNEKNNFYEDILRSQIGQIENYIPKENLNEEEEDNSNNQSENTNLQLAQTDLQTEVVTQNPIQLNYNYEYENVKIKNGTSFELTQDILNPNINIENKNIILFHTHTCESYTSSDLFPYTPTGNYRTIDLNFSVARVGDELENHLKQYGYNVIHNKAYHDYPSYNGSYANSLETVEGILNDTPSDIILDIHRDAIGSRPDYAPCVKIGDDIAAQIMFVIGTNEGGLWHPNWQQNLKFAVKVQQKAEELYPGLFKPIMLTKYRYNQHTGKFASIIEVGATGNTLEQCNNSMKYLAKVLDEVIQLK